MSDKNQIDVSVIITVYNIKKYIGDCLKSILSQEDVNFEVICVDDSSTDGSFDILNEYAKKDKRVSVLRNPVNMGLSSTRNVGFRVAQGEYLYNVDGDDLIRPGTLSRLYSCSKENSLDLLSFSAISFFDSEEMKQYGNEDDYVRKFTYPGIWTGAELFVKLLENNDRATSNQVLYFYNRKFFEDNHLYGVEGLRYADDSMFAIYMAAKRVMCIPDQLYMRRYREGSAVTSPMKKCYMENMIVLFLAEMQIWQASELSDELNKKIEKYFNMRQDAIRGFHHRFKNDRTEMSVLNKNIMAGYFYKYFIAEVPLYKNYMTESKLQTLKQADTVVLYGAGYIATEIAKVLEYNGIDNYKVAVTNRLLEHESFRGKRILNIKELINERDTADVIVAMAEKYFEEVDELLKTLGFQNIMWVPSYKG